ncbi:imidazole glycerol phosphate synthase subunit HisH [Aquibacillus sp. 3ASR75-11]|uniref:Imidazole glycerol phosphate synthase subunit HisH n=1 Tax=Terrihalobacillus insolitus TaxID=2950438 RepID=A0A9X3WZH5_9BACI|nr:imidazole glycerol phosphate synthase subunit HisH [Terrihalobacillus insolitus]MDC3426209.1 imidazole glycerol phosphate synthase subunit HisH [Terrihalobacillus insolitus]
MIAIVDYGMGNVASVSTAFQRLGYDVILTDQQEELKKASHIVLPGVGSFQAAVDEITDRGLRDILIELATEKPFLGICLGMQLLFSTGYEGGETTGLNLIPGKVKKMNTDFLLPHIGWNALNINHAFPSYQRFQGDHVYFVHSYAVETDLRYVVATTDYDKDVTAIVKKGNVTGIQFHPEKSGDIGMDILKTFLQEDSHDNYSSN